MIMIAAAAVEIIVAVVGLAVAVSLFGTRPVKPLSGAVGLLAVDERQGRGRLVGTADHGEKLEQVHGGLRLRQDQLHVVGSHDGARKLRHKLLHGIGAVEPVRQNGIEDGCRLPADGSRVKIAQTASRDRTSRRTVQSLRLEHRYHLRGDLNGVGGARELRVAGSAHLVNGRDEHVEDLGDARVAVAPQATKQLRLPRP